MENEEVVPAQEPLFEIEEAPFVPITNKEIDYIGALEGFVPVSYTHLTLPTICSV